MKINRTLVGCLILFLTFRLGAQDPSSVVSSENNSREEAFIDAQRDFYIGRSDKALEKYEALYKEDRTDAAVAFELVKLYAAKKDLLQVERYATTIATHGSKNTPMLEYINKIYVDNGKYSLAEKGLNELILLMPVKKDYYTSLGNLYKVQGKNNELLALLTKQEMKFGKSYEVSKQKYEYYLRNKEDDKMLEELKYITSKNPADKDIIKQTALHYNSIGNSEKALIEYQKVLAIADLFH